jgi:hypothetical protein
VDPEDSPGIFPDGPVFVGGVRGNDDKLPCGQGTGLPAPEGIIPLAFPAIDKDRRLGPLRTGAGMVDRPRIATYVGDYEELGLEMIGKPVKKGIGDDKLFILKKTGAFRIFHISSIK